MKKIAKILMGLMTFTMASGFISCKKNEPKGLDMVEIPGMSIKMLRIEVTQELYESVMGENPSYFKGENNPVEQVSWYDAIYFCNKLSEKEGLTPVYSVNGIKDVSKWGYTPHNKEELEGNIRQNLAANGYRLPTEEEWEYAAKGGQNYTYSGSNNLKKVGWYEGNSGDRTHSVAQKKANGYGLYDMSGNVWEWCGDVDPYYSISGRYRCGGSYSCNDYGCSKVDYRYYSSAGYQDDDLGFRIVCSVASGFSGCKKNELKGLDMVEMPGMSIKMLRTEVTQKLYESVMGENPSYFKGENNPVEQVSWYDAIYFCNKLSEKEGLTPVYSVNGITDVSKWGYTPHNKEELEGNIRQILAANGYRLPTKEEWEYAAEGGEDYEYSGSDNLDEVGWYEGNSGDRTHSVAQKKANGHGLYDMSGNVWEWCWDVSPGYGSYRWRRGGSYYDSAHSCKVDCSDHYYANYQSDFLGFRIVCSASN